MRFAVSLPLDAGEQDKEIGTLSKHTSRCWGLEVRAAKVVVEALQAPAFGEVLPLRLADTRQDIEVRSQPSIVFSKQPGNELAWVVGACSHQVFPGGLGPCTPG